MTELEEFRSAIADPVRGPEATQIALLELERVITVIRADDAAAVPYSDAELMRRVDSYRASTEGLAQMSALAGYWAPDTTAMLWPRLVAAMLGARDRGSGLSVWLDLVAYPGLLVLYAFGLGASIAGRHARLAGALAAPAPDEQKRWRPAILVANSTSLRDDVAMKLSGVKSPRWPLSDHLYSVSRAWFAEMVPHDGLYEREFDRFEILASLIYYDLERGDGERAWSPIGRFARFGRYDHAIADALIAEARWAATEGHLLQSLHNADEGRAEATLAGFREHVSKALAQVW